MERPRAINVVIVVSNHHQRKEWQWLRSTENLTRVDPIRTDHRAISMAGGGRSHVPVGVSDLAGTQTEAVVTADRPGIADAMGSMETVTEAKDIAMTIVRVETVPMAGIPAEGRSVGSTVVMTGVMGIVVTIAVRGRVAMAVTTVVAGTATIVTSGARAGTATMGRSAATMLRAATRMARYPSRLRIHTRIGALASHACPKGLNGPCCRRTSVSV